ncbi:MAG: hypothetical protein V4708_17495 [Bacteroidota bacterium]
MYTVVAAAANIVRPLYDPDGESVILVCPVIAGVVIVGVTSAGDVANTVTPEPVAVVEPVPPFAIGRAVPEYVNASVPEVVTGEPVIDRNAGTVAATEVTVPVPGADGVCQERVVPFEVRT